MPCSECKKNVGLACMHVVCAACVQPICAECGNEALDLATALEKNNLAPPNRHVHFKRLPQSSTQPYKGAMMNTYSPHTHSLQVNGDDGAWILLQHRTTLEVWHLDPYVRWMGSVADGTASFLVTAQVNTQTGIERMPEIDDACLVMVGGFLELINSQIQ